MKTVFNLKSFKPWTLERVLSILIGMVILFVVHLQFPSVISTTALVAGWCAGVAMGHLHSNDISLFQGTLRSQAVFVFTVLLSIVAGAAIAIAFGAS